MNQPQPQPRGQHQCQGQHEHGRPHRAPSDCPVCSAPLVTTRLGCPQCGTEIGGQFERCSFCALDAAQLELLTIFLASRGNLREVAKRQQVSYPTARSRLQSLLQALGIAQLEADAEPSEGDDLRRDEAEPRPSRQEVLARVQSGQTSPEEAARLLRGH